MTETKPKLSFNIEKQCRKVPVIIVAAGNSRRMGQNKLLMEISGIPVIARTMLCFERCEAISRIIVVTREEDINRFELIAEEYGISKLTDIVNGGNSRQESVLNGFKMLDKDEWAVLIHDGARPMTSEKTVTGVIKGLENSSAVTCAVKVKDTIKEISPDGKVIKTLNRDSLVAVQTPQGVIVKDYLDAVEKIGDVSLYTDDMSVMEAAGYSVLTTEGDYKNIKITTPEDILAAESYINKYEE